MDVTETAVAAASPATEANPVAHSSQNDPREPIASTSGWVAPLVRSGELRKNRPGFRWPNCARKFAPVFKGRKGNRSAEKAVPSVTVAVTSDGGGMKITQIEPSGTQTALRGNKRRSRVNARLETSDARILSEFHVDGGKKNVLVSVTLQVESDDVSSRQAETQTSASDLTAAVTFGYPDRSRPRPAFLDGSKIVRCFDCNKPVCYEIKRSLDTISSSSLEETLAVEYPERPEFDGHVAEPKRNSEFSRQLTSGDISQAESK